MRGSVVTSNAVSTINNERDMQTACSSSLLGVPRRVRVVNAIRWCGSPTSTTIGCAYTPGSCMVVVRYNSTMEGALWAHEFGHSKGLPHRDVSDAIMHSTIDTTRKMFSAGECSRIRQLGFVRQSGPPYTGSKRLATQLPVGEFVRQTFVNGMPYDEGRLYSVSEVSTVVGILQNKTESTHWANVANLIGIVAPSNAYQTLQQFIFSPSSGVLPIDEFNGRAAAVMAMGYIIKANGSSAARAFLEKHSIASNWSTVQWKAPYHNSNSERDADLAEVAVLGLSLAADDAAISALQRLRPIAGRSLRVSQRKALMQTIDQAIAYAVKQKSRQ